MNIIPYIATPQIEEVLKYIKKIPCSMQVEEVILNEVAKGNKLKDIGDAGSWPNETVVIIRFKEDAKDEYPNMGVMKFKNGNECRRLCFVDNSGAVEFRFGN